jgi:hypothetical protein
MPQQGHTLYGFLTELSLDKCVGGGFVALLNEASGTPTPAPECAQTVDGTSRPSAGPDNILILAGNSQHTLSPGEAAQAGAENCWKA